MIDKHYNARVQVTSDHPTDTPFTEIPTVDQIQELLDGRRNLSFIKVSVRHRNSSSIQLASFSWELIGAPPTSDIIVAKMKELETLFSHG